MTLDKKEANREGTDEPLIRNQEQLIQILHALEQDDTILYASEEQHIFLL